MSKGCRWHRQLGEIEACNTFLSAYHSRASYHGFSTQGYDLVNYFPTISDPHSGVTARPDFTLYNGHTLILVEVKQGDNIEQDHVDQMQRYNRVTIDKAEQHLKNSAVRRRFGYRGGVHEIESCIVYDGLDEEYIKNCRNKWPSCREQLNEIEKEGPVLAQEQGGKLRVVAGSFASPSLQSWLSYGISLPMAPRTTVSMNEQFEKESVAAAICRIWGEKAVSAPVYIDIKDIQRKFSNRELERVDVVRALELLKKHDVCSKEQDEFVFKPSHMGNIMSISDILCTCTDENQTSLS